ncbi:hypothetical protein INR49_004612, partial [Caranx melampygus]
MSLTKKEGTVCAGEGRYPKLPERQCCLRFVTAPPADGRLVASTEWKQEDRKRRAEKWAVPSLWDEAEPEGGGEKERTGGRGGEAGPIEGHRSEVWSNQKMAEVKRGRGQPECLHGDWESAMPLRGQRSLTRRSICHAASGRSQSRETCQIKRTNQRRGRRYV